MSQPDQKPLRAKRGFSFRALFSRLSATEEITHSHAAAVRVNRSSPNSSPAAASNAAAIATRRYATQPGGAVA
jgi:hypothetical protein